MAQFRHRGDSYEVQGELVARKFLLEPDNILLTISMWGASEPPATISTFTTIEPVSGKEAAVLCHDPDVQIARRI
jgi:hypothetical protein